MASWKHCEDTPEPHEGHEWNKVHGYDVQMRPQTSAHMCPGVKADPSLMVLIEARDVLRRQLAALDADVGEYSVRARRTPHQYTVNDDNAPAEDPG